MALLDILPFDFLICSTNHPQLKQFKRVTRVSHACDTCVQMQKTRMASDHVCTHV